MDLKPLLTDAAQRSARYLDSLQERSVAPSKDGVHDLAKFDLELQDHPMDPDAVLRELDEIGSPATMGIAGPRFFGFVMGGSLPAALAADFMTSAWDQNTGLYNVTPATARLEQVALRWMLELLDLPRETAGVTLYNPVF